MNRFDPIESLADMRHEFGEHGGVNMSIEASTTFTVTEPEASPSGPPTTTATTLRGSISSRARAA